MSYIKADKGWWFWKFTEEKNKEYLKRQLQINRNKLSALKINRTYNDKPNGKKRPTGSPVQRDKASLTGITEILKLIIEPSIGEYLHGFMTGRSITQPLVKLTERILKGDSVYQFDLSSFFNRVNVHLVCGRVNSRAKGLGNWLLNITNNTFPHIKTYHPERDVTKFTYKGGELYRKEGFTQGSPSSPLLCNIALEFAGFTNITGLIQYADDRVITGKTKEINYEFDNVKARLAGIHLAEDKELGWSMRFKFLGIKFDLWNRTIEGNDGTKLRYNESSYKTLLDFYKKYGSYTEIKDKKATKEGKIWYWKVVSGSLCERWNPPQKKIQGTKWTPNIKTE